MCSWRCGVEWGHGAQPVWHADPGPICSPPPHLHLRCLTLLDDSYLIVKTCVACKKK